jgi:hypothetical protein
LIIKTIEIDMVRAIDNNEIKWIQTVSDQKQRLSTAALVAPPLLFPHL